MAPNEKWVKRFEATMGREPSVAEYQQGKATDFDLDLLAEWAALQGNVATETKTEAKPETDPETKSETKPETPGAAANQALPEQSNRAADGGTTKAAPHDEAGEESTAAAGGANTTSAATAAGAANTASGVATRATTAATVAHDDRTSANRSAKRHRALPRPALIGIGVAAVVVILAVALGLFWHHNQVAESAARASSLSAARVSSRAKAKAQAASKAKAQAAASASRAAAAKPPRAATVAEKLALVLLAPGAEKQAMSGQQLLESGDKVTATPSSSLYSDVPAGSHAYYLSLSFEGKTPTITIVGDHAYMVASQVAVPYAYMKQKGVHVDLAAAWQKQFKSQDLAKLVKQLTVKAAETATADESTAAASDASSANDSEVDVHNLTQAQLLHWVKLALVAHGADESAVNDSDQIGLKPGFTDGFATVAVYMWNELHTVQKWEYTYRVNANGELEYTGSETEDYKPTGVDYSE
ncbi:hypothetical protein [Lacticaseibacillus parakribbianus]|uniref:hypothetical protein n=1 Tax=Lacticaseibacillus parakribbianus TaxID=2970927 RepID=UPI0021CAFA46|nr:hypothetical protein [Lacticaseibacillus parakribbianus]